MAYHNRPSFNEHTIGQGDLDLQPVREIKLRILNDIPKEPVVPPPLPPQVKFNFVDVTFPDADRRDLESTQSHHHRNANRTSRKRSNIAHEKEESTRDQVKYDKENSYYAQARSNMERDSQKYLCKLLRQGVPVWEEVPEEERAARVIPGSNPFRHHPYSSNPLTSNIIHRNTNKQKKSKIQAVWEDVKDGSKNSYPLEHGNDFIVTPREATSEPDDVSLKSKAERLNQYLRKTSNNDNTSDTHSGSQDHIEVNKSAPESPASPCSVSNEVCGSEAAPVHPTSEGQSVQENEESQPLQESPRQSVTDQEERPTRPLTKKMHGGRVDNDVTSSLSWWPGDKMYKERNKSEEEEKHEKESTKEKNGKREPSTLTSDTHKKKHHGMTTQEVNKDVEKIQPKMKHYEVEQVRKYMKEKQSERSKAIKELHKKQEQEKIQRNERMKELAIKTKHLSQANKKGACDSAILGLTNEKQDQPKQQQPLVNWGSSNTWKAETLPGTSSPNHKPTHMEEHHTHSSNALLIPSSTKPTKLLKCTKAESDVMASQTPVTNEENKEGDVNLKKRSKKDNRRRKKRRSMSESEAISDIVSRTVQECERQVKSSSVSVESLSSLSSFSCTSSDTESRSSQCESISSSLDLSPKERTVALGQLAQRLTTRVTQETCNLTHRDHRQETSTPSPRVTTRSTEKRVAQQPPPSSSNPRASLSLSQIEKMSVEELIAKMTAMLPNKSVNKGRTNTNQSHQRHQITESNKSVSESQKYDRAIKTQTQSENVVPNHTQDTPVKSSLQELHMDEIPKLIDPEVPKLKLTSEQKKLKELHKFDHVENRSSSGDQRVMHRMKNLTSQTNEENQVFVKMIPTYKPESLYVPLLPENSVPGRNHNQLDAFIEYLNVDKKKFDHAATVIQAAYRGYRVRKITSSLVKRLSLTNKRNISEIKCGVKGNIEGSMNRTKEVASNFGREQINWRKIKSELQSKTFEPRKESYYISQKSDLPGWIRPYFVLTETGDINHFLESHTNKPNSGDADGAANRIKITRPESIDDRIQNQDQSHLSVGKSLHDVTLTEGPLSDLERETVCFNKETQTTYNRSINIKNKQNFNKENIKVKQSSDAETFVDLKEFSKPKVFTSKNKNNLSSLESAKTQETSAKKNFDITHSESLQKDHNDTLEEGELEDIPIQEQSCQTSHNETLETGSIETIEGSPVMEASGTIDSSNSNTSVLVEEVCAPHELLGKNVHIGPESLRLRLNAELRYQDTLGKALNQLHNVEQLNILNRSRQEAMALSHSLALQQQKVDIDAHSKRINDMKVQEEAKQKDDYERRLKEKLKQQEEALQKVEMIEKEARSRFADLEKEVRLRTEQMLAQATERVPPQPTNPQSDVIAAAAVAAVGATLSQWKQLKPVQDYRSHDYVTTTQGTVSSKSVSNQDEYFTSKISNDELHLRTQDVVSLSKYSQPSGDKTSSFVSEKMDENVMKSSVIEEIPISKTSVEEEIESQEENVSEDSVPESIISSESIISKVSQKKSGSTTTIKSISNKLTHSNDSISVNDGKSLPKRSINTSSISEKIESVSGTHSKVTSDEVMSASNLIPEDVSHSITSGTVSEAISRNVTSIGTPNIETDTLTGRSHSPTQKSLLNIKDNKRHQMKESTSSRNVYGSSLMNLFSKSKEKERKIEDRETSDVYSESFEIDSESETSNTVSSQPQGRVHGGYGGDLSLVVSSGNMFNDMGYKASGHGSIHGGALGVTLSVVESLLKEEEVHHQHQTALLKLQEQSLVEEAKRKLSALQSEGGPSTRRRQRVVVLQLREQRAYLRRLRETQNIGAQQRKLMLLQLHHLLGTSTSFPGVNTKGFITTSRGHSPNPSSPRLTPRLFEMHSSSSSDNPDDVTLNMLVRSRDTDSSSLSESGGGGGAREKRRSHSEDRQKIPSGRVHEKRRTAEIEALQQQLLYEDKEILRLKSKTSFDFHDKDSVKSKRKGDFVTKRSREKKEKSTGSVSPHSVLKQGSRTSTDTSVPIESIADTSHQTQSSVPEEGVSESLSNSNVTSSISEQEGLTSRSYRIGSSQSKDTSSVKRVLSYAVSERDTNSSPSSKMKMTSGESETIQEQLSSKDSKNNEKSSSVKTLNSGKTVAPGEEKLRHNQTERFSKPSEKSIRSEFSEISSKSDESSMRIKFSTTGSVKLGSNKSDSSIPEMTDSSKVRTSINSSLCSIEKRTDFDASSSDTKSLEGKSFSQKSSTRGLPLPLKVPLSPRSPHRQHRRYSSESDDSFTLSQTETASDMSDGEGRLLALKEELAVRRAEAERLKKEKRRLRRERLASQERALKQQISTYDAYIQNARMELEKESKELQQASMVRPLIKKPQVAETKKSRLSESFAQSPEKSDISDASLVSESSKSDHSTSISKSLEASLKEMNQIKPHEIIKSQELHLKNMGVPLHKDHLSSKSTEEIETKNQSSSSKKSTTESSESQGENESDKTSLASSVSENISEEITSEHTEDDAFFKKSFSQESSGETDHSQSQGSSTETIVHSPQKLDSSQRDDAAVSMNEVNAALLEVLKDNDTDEHVDIVERENSHIEIKSEEEKKLEIFIPTFEFKSSEAEEYVEGNTNTSAEQSMCEEIFDEIYEEAESENFSHETESAKNILLPTTTTTKDDFESHEEVEKEERSLSLSHSENKLSSTEAETPTPLTAEPKETPSQDEENQHPNPDRQRLADDISNNILAVIMKDTNQLFTDILKHKVDLSKISEEKSHDEAGKGSMLDSSNVTSEPHMYDGSLITQENPNTAKLTFDNKSQILQRVNELIGESGSVSSHVTSVTSPRSGNVHPTPQMTFDVSSESPSPLSPPTAKEKSQSQDVSPLGAGEKTVPSDSSSQHKEEKDDDSLSPSHDLVKAEEYKLDTDTLTNRLLNLASAPDLELEAQLDQLGDNAEFSVEGIEGNWFDDDFWTSCDNKKKQQQLKAEEERITAEIARLEELQHLQQKYPGLVIREVPNKPPPPYTPPQVTSPPSSPVSSPAPTPSRPPAYTTPPPSNILPEAEPLSPTHSSSISHRLSKADQRRLAAHVTQIVPIAQEEALPIIDRALDILYQAWQNNIDPADIPPPSYTSSSSSSSLSSFSAEDMHEDEKTSTRAFHLLLFCLAQELLSIPYKLQHATLPPPWMKQVLPQGRIFGMMNIKSRDGWFTYVREKVKVLFGWKPSLQKESLMIRWAQKHRDLVDQVLVKELQAEEASWTNYEEDEAAVKSKVASEIFDTMLSETIALMSCIVVKKVGYIAH